MTEIDLGDRCVKCGRDTTFGSGLFVNRIPADDVAEDGHPLLGREFDGQTVHEGDELCGYMCEECQTLKCDRCGRSTVDYSLIDGDVVCAECVEG